MDLRVLIVDDSTISRRMMQRTLQMSGVTMVSLHEAGDGAHALALLEGNPVDLALVDINMPGMNGEQLLAEIRKRPDVASLPVVVVSTEASEARIARIRDQRAEFVHKPFDPGELRQAILRAVEAGHD